MTQHSFDEVPFKTFLFRMILGPSILAFAVGYILVGVVSNCEDLEVQHKSVVVVPVLTAAEEVYSELKSDLVDPPQGCWTRSTVNDFQEEECQEYWEDLINTMSISSLPILSVALFLFLSLRFLKRFYRQEQRKLLEGQMISVGIATHPLEASSDLFSWFFCLNPITIQLKNKGQIKVYLPSGGPRVRSGDQVAVVDQGTVWGEVRYIAILYTPHLVVLRGA